MPGGAVHKEPDAPFEQSLVSSIGARLPIFGLLNIQEPVRSDGVRNIYVPPDQWVDHVVRYAAHAKLILLCIDSLTESLWREIEVLDSTDAGSRLFLSVTQQVHDAMLRHRRSLIERARWVSIRESRWGEDRVWNAGVPPQLLRWLDGEPEPPEPPKPREASDSHFSMKPLH
jgi:hypothetical protein